MDQPSIGNLIKRKIIRRIGIMVLVILASFALPFVWPFLPDGLNSAFPVIILLVVVGAVGAALYAGWKAWRIGSKILSGKLTAEDVDPFVKMANKNLGADLFENPLRALHNDIPNGLPATATVIACRQGHQKISMGVKEYYQLLIDVVVRNGDTWPATIKYMAPITQVGAFQPGASFAVKYDPADRGRVVVDAAVGV